MNQLDAASRIKRWIVFAIVTLMAIDLVVVVSEKQWLSAFLILTIALLILLVTLFSDRLAVQIPAEFQILALVFVFSALFLGEVRSYYEKIWWWDIALHSTSGLLMGILGFLLVYVLNASEKIAFSMTPRFLAFFAFMFAVAVGTLWEIFEYLMDTIFGANMQKAMFDDPSGLTDTMWDMIVNAIGAAFISTLGWWYMKRKRRSFIDVWIQKFIQRNPDLFES
ncbi:MAG TPA: hypothetical protein PKH39_14265 [Woeseiaceae bacterium]|nr:hypothetical protein [Woeseiaceae bacterium]